jgi:tRNA(His) guanylyltransferase
MSNSKFEFVKKYEQSNILLPNTFIVVRIDGRSFTDFCSTHEFVKPNDMRQIKLMNSAAMEVMKSFTDIVLAYGQSDEYSFVFKKSTKVFNRREDKILSCVLSLFSSSYTFRFGEFFKEEDGSMMRPKRIPSFDARIVLYPAMEDLKAYLSWRQVDCHINNLYNTVFWKLVKEGQMTPADAHKKLKGTFSKDKHEIMFSQFGCNYNDEPEVFKRGNTLIRMSNSKSK